MQGLGFKIDVISHGAYLHSIWKQTLLLLTTLDTQMYAVDYMRVPGCKWLHVSGDTSMFTYTVSLLTILETPFKFNTGIPTVTSHWLLALL